MIRFRISAWPEQHLTVQKRGDINPSSHFAIGSRTLFLHAWSNVFFQRTTLTLNFKPCRCWDYIVTKPVSVQISSISAGHITKHAQPEWPNSMKKCQCSILLYFLDEILLFHIKLFYNWSASTFLLCKKEQLYFSESLLFLYEWIRLRIFKVTRRS